MKGMLTIFVLLLSIAATACKQSSVQKPVKEQSPPPLPSTQVTIQEPLFENSPVGFREAWRKFSKDGRYRMAQANEAKGERFKPFHYDWSNNLLVIVTDTTTQIANDRLRLAYFKVPKTEKGEYRLFWVMHNHDLSKAYIGNASSDLVVTDQGGLASRSSFLKWDREKQQYICLVN